MAIETASLQIINTTSSPVWHFLCQLVASQPLASRGFQKRGIRWKCGAIGEHFSQLRERNLLSLSLYIQLNNQLLHSTIIWSEGNDVISSLKVDEDQTSRKDFCQLPNARTQKTRRECVCRPITAVNRIHSIVNFWHSEELKTSLITMTQKFAEEKISELNVCT